MMLSQKTLTRLALATALVSGLSSAASAAEISFFRFFGDCQNDYGTVTDVNAANGECGIITALVNKFNAENTIGAKVVTQTVDWGTYYDQLTATYSTGNIPDVAVMHASVLPNFSDRELLTPLGDGFAKVGIDTADYVPAALSNASRNGTVYALPFDLHAILFHVNMDLMAQAGLVNDDGSPKMPTSPEELISMGKTFKEKTGKTFIASEGQSNEGMMVRLWESFMWQQGVDVLSADGKTASIATPEGEKAAALIKSLYDEGLSNSALDYAGAEQAFLNGEAGILLNGTWVVDAYNAQATGGQVALKNYRVANVPGIYGKDAVWADSHMWVMPKDDSRPADEVEASLAFMKFLNDNDFQWSRTGHLSVRQSVIASPEFAALPHRAEFAATADHARAIPAVQNARAIYDGLVTELTAMWLTGAAPADAVAAMQDSTDQILRRNR